MTGGWGRWLRLRPCGKRSGGAKAFRLRCPEAAYAVLAREIEEGAFQRCDGLDEALLALLRLAEPGRLCRAPEMSEGLENRLLHAAQACGYAPGCHCRRQMQALHLGAHFPRANASGAGNGKTTVPSRTIAAICTVAWLSSCERANARGNKKTRTRAD